MKQYIKIKNPFFAFDLRLREFWLNLRMRIICMLLSKGDKYKILLCIEEAKDAIKYKETLLKEGYEGQWCKLDALQKDFERHSKYKLPKVW